MRRVGFIFVLLLAGCQTNAANEAKTVAWLQTQGFSYSAAQSLANNGPALRKYVMDRQSSETDDGYCKSLGARTGTDAYVQCRVSVSNNRSSQVEAKRNNDALRREIADTVQPAPNPIRAPEIAAPCAQRPCY